GHQVAAGPQAVAGFEGGARVLHLREPAERIVARPERAPGVLGGFAMPRPELCPAQPVEVIATLATRGEPAPERMRGPFGPIEKEQVGPHLEERVAASGVEGTERGPVPEDEATRMVCRGRLRELGVEEGSQGRVPVEIADL